VSSDKQYCRAFSPHIDPCRSITHKTNWPRFIQLNDERFGNTKGSAFKPNRTATRNRTFEGCRVIAI
jgi:hypothetical protein